MKRFIRYVFRAYVETFKHVPPGALHWSSQNRASGGPAHPCVPPRGFPLPYPVNPNVFLIAAPPILPSTRALTAF